jgi:hypothetical protein
VILVATVSLGTQPALSGDAVQDAQPSAIARPAPRAFGVRGAFQSIRIRELAMGTWVAFAIGVSGALLLKLFALQF